MKINKLFIIVFLLIFSVTEAALVLDDLGVNVNLVTFVGHANDDRLFISQQTG